MFTVFYTLWFGTLVVIVTYVLDTVARGLASRRKHGWAQADKTMDRSPLRVLSI